jgi:hypothetical protein
MQSIIFMEEIPNCSAGLMPVKTFDGIEFIDFTNIIRFQADSKHTLNLYKGPARASKLYFGAHCY